MKKPLVLVVGIVLVVIIIGGGVVLSRMKSVPQGAQQAVTTSTPDAKFSMSDVASHADSVSCYTVINNSVYDLTDWIRKHPGGSQNILRICGKDGSQAFMQQHGGATRPERILDGFQIGVLTQ